MRVIPFTAELADALAGCQERCEFSAGSVVNHCDTCCRKITAIVWRLSRDVGAV